MIEFVVLVVLLLTVLPKMGTYYKPREKPKEVRARDKAYRKDKRTRMMASRDTITDKNGNVFIGNINGSYRLARFHIIRNIKTFFRRIWIKFFTRRGLVSTRWDIQIYLKEHPHATFIFLGMFVAGYMIAIYHLFGPVGLMLGAGPLLLGSAIQPYEILGTGMVEATEFGSDIASIQLAINYARTNSKPCIYVGPGTWSGGAADKLIFDGASSTWNGIIFRGAGMGSTNLDFSSLSGDTAIKFTQSGTGTTRVNNILFENITIIGNSNAHYGVWFDYSQHIQLNQVYIQDFNKTGSTYAGLCLFGVYDSVILQVYLWDNYYGMYATSVNDMFVLGGQAISNDNIGVFLIGHSNTFIKFVSESNGGVGIFSSRGTRNSILECYFEHNTDAQIKFTGSFTDAQPSFQNKVRDCYSYGDSYTAYGVVIERSDTCQVVGSLFWGHTVASISLGGTGSDNHVFNTYTENNWTGTRSWATADPLLLKIRAMAFGTVVNENSNMYSLIENAGHFTIMFNMTTAYFKVGNATSVSPGDFVKRLSTDDTGMSVVASTASNEETVGVIYDGRLDTLASDANSGQKNIVVTDIYQWYGLEGREVKMIDDSNTETLTIDTITLGSSTIAVTTNLVNSYTTAANARLLLSFAQNEYVNVIKNGPVEYLHVNGTQDIAVGNYISAYSTAGVGHYGYDNFIAQALEAYTANNSNGYINAFIVPLFKSTKVNIPFTLGFGGATSGSDQGWQLNAGGEYISCYANIPEKITTCLRLRVTAVSNVVEADGMRMQIDLRAGGQNEPYNTHSQGYTQTSNTLNFIQLDIIEWIVDHDATLLAVSGGDSVLIKCNYSAASGADCATDAYFREATIYCI